MTEQGYIKLHRSIMSWEWYQDSKTKDVFLHLLLNAQWEDSRFQGYEVPKGSLVTSYDSLAAHLKMSPKSVRTAISHLKKSKEVSVKRHSHFSIITIANWEKYQCLEDESGNLSGNQRAIKGQSKGNIKEYKEYKEYKKSISGNDLYKMGMSGNYDFDELERETRDGN